jgi:hypothetical protein
MYVQGNVTFLINLEHRLPAPAVGIDNVSAAMRCNAVQYNCSPVVNVLVPVHLFRT